MAGLQRSSETFRRSGSSGLVWEDRFLSNEEADQAKQIQSGRGDGGTGELRVSRSIGSAGAMMRSLSNSARAYRTGRVSPALDPPSPKVSACGFCSFFGKSSIGPPATKRAKPRGRS